MPFFRLVPYGPPATLALRDVLSDIKALDPLAPVTVAVPSNYAGLSLRRALGSAGHALANGRPGLVNVRFLVFARVAELLGAPSLAADGLRPLAGTVRAEAVRTVLAADPGPFHAVAAHAATERGLELSFRDLRLAPPKALDAVAGRSDRAAHVVRLYRAFRELTASYYDEEDLAFAAAGAVRAGAPAQRDVGHVALHLPRRITPGGQALVETLARAGGLSAVLGLTGDAEADAPARGLAARLSRALGAPVEEAPPEPPAGTRVVAVTDAEEEVRTALRLIMERLEQGTPLHRMAVLYPSTEPYAALVHEQFHAAGVPHNGPSVRTLAQTVSGRTLLGVLRLRDQHFRREVVMDWLSAAPVLEEAGRNPAPAHRWDAISRSAGVVRGAAQWRDRLARFGRSLEAQRAALERTDEPDEWRLRRIETDLGQATRLATFIEELAERVRPASRATWSAFAAWGRELLQRYLGGEGHRSDWPVEEVQAHRAVEDALQALSTLGDVRERMDEAAFRRALERELEAPAARVGRFGDGVFAGRIGDALGTGFDAVFLLGMSEGLVPPRARDDPLLPDRERAAAGEAMPLRAGRPAEDRRDYLAALAVAPDRTLIFPRADLRGQRGRLPSRWLLETASRLEGRAVYSSEIETLSRPWYDVVPSFEGALAGEGAVASPQEYDLRSLLTWSRGGAPVREHYLVADTPALRAGLEADAARLGGGLTRWDGRLADAEGLAPGADRPVSPTALQHWATCPFRYFLGHVLRVAETEKPEDTLRLTPLERGNLVHHALERFIRDARPRTGPHEAWSADERARLIAIGEQLCDEAERAGLTGRALLWRLDRARVLRDLRGFLDADERFRAQHGVVPQAVELSFGLDGGAPLEVALDGGRTIAFRGRIDRVDRSPDGRRVIVIDYKTGRSTYHKVTRDDPLSRGRLLQLPVYALAARGEPPAEVEAYYWFVTEREQYALTGPVDDDGLERFREALPVIVDGIEQGLFPARPGKRSDGAFANCTICPYDRVCSRDRARVWERKAGAPELGPYLGLTGGDG